MDFADIYPVTTYLHAFEASSITKSIASGISPHGYVDFLAEFGIGSVCDGLTVLPPKGHKGAWDTELLDEYILARMRWWTGYDLTEDDVRNCAVVAESDESDFFITCPRHGRKVIELPRGSENLRVVGDSISDLIRDYASTRGFAFPFFDPWRWCSRRCAIGFEVRHDIGLKTLIDELTTRWGNGGVRSAVQPTDEWAYQDLFVRDLHACFGFYLEDRRAPEHRRPEGSIKVTATLDSEFVNPLLKFAKELSYPDAKVPWINRGMRCDHDVGE